MIITLITIIILALGVIGSIFFTWTSWFYSQKFVNSLEYIELETQDLTEEYYENMQCRNTRTYK